MYSNKHQHPSLNQEATLARLFSWWGKGEGVPHISRPDVSTVCTYVR